MDTESRRLKDCKRKMIFTTTLAQTTSDDEKEGATCRDWAVSPSRVAQNALGCPIGVFSVENSGPRLLPSNGFTNSRTCFVRGSSATVDRLLIYELCL